MIDQNEILTTQEPHLTPEQIAKSDRDLASLDAIKGFANSNNCVLQIIGGYATEAHLEGRITRPHRDMDAVLWLDKPETEEDNIKKIKDTLSSDGATWTLLPAEKDHFADYRRENQTEDFSTKGRLELYFYDKKRAKKLITKTIVDSRGNIHELDVEPIESLVAGKIAIIQRNLDLGEGELKRRKLRATNETDIADLSNLIKHPSFSLERWYPAMIDYLQYGDNKLSEEEARLKAQTMWNNAMKVIEYSPQKIQ
jgi:hypothetical protein